MHLLFINGLSCTQEAWGALNTLRANYPSLDADTIHFDSMKAMADAAEQQVDPKENYCVIGFSMGGFVAIRLAVRSLSWIKKLVLINTTAAGMDEATRARRTEGLVAAEKGDVDTYVNALKGLCFHNATPELESRCLEMARQLGPLAFINQQKAIITRTDCMEELARIPIPTLIISSREDRLLPVADSIRMHALIPDSKLLLIPACGHFSPLEKGAEITDAIEAFLRG